MKCRFSKKLSFILVFAMIVQLMSFVGAITVSAATTNKYTGTIVQGGEDYFNAAKLKGAYIEATSVSDGHIGIHMNALKDEIDSSYVTELVPASDTAKAAELGWTNELLGSVSDTSYVTQNKDGAWLYRVQLEQGNWVDNTSVAADADIKDVAFYTQGNYRISNNTVNSVPGSIYFNLDDTFSTGDNEITFVVEYLDIGTRDLTLTHLNNTSSGNDRGHNNFSVTRTNTGLWKTAVFVTTEAKFRTNNSGLGTGKEDIKINANYGNTYIKRIGVIKTADLKQNSSSDFDVSNVTYKNAKKQYTHYIAGGDIITSVDVTNNGEAASNAALYTAVYDKNEAMVAVAKSALTDIAAGETKTLTTDSPVNMPNSTDYTFRKYIWTSNLTPSYSVDEADKLVLSATAYDRRVLLSWSEYTSEIPLENTVFYIYRDGNLIGSSKTSAYYDDHAAAGEHTWQIEAVSESTGEVVYRSNYAVAAAVDNLENGNGVYIKARQDYVNGFQAINGKHSDIEKGLHLSRTANLYTLDEIQNYHSYVTDKTAADGVTSTTLGQIEFAKSNGIKYITNSSDGPTRTLRITDSSGVTKDAWHTSYVLRCGSNTEYSIRSAYMYFNVLEGSGITSEDSDITIFVEFLAKGRTSLGLEYLGYKTAEDGTKTVSTQNSKSVSFAETGNWAVAQFNLDNASFTIDDSSVNKFAGTTDFRIKSDNKDVYVSSVYVTKATGSDAVYEYTSLRDRDFGTVREDISNKHFPNGVSIDFSSGKAVENGVKLYSSTEGEADNRAAVYENGYVENTYLVVNDAPKQTRLYFEVNDNYHFGQLDSINYIMEIEYIDDFIGDMIINHNQWKGWYEVPVYGGAETVLATGTGSGEVKTATVKLNNVQLRNTHGNGNADFYIYVPYGENNQTLKIKRLKVKNLSLTPRAHLAE